MNAAFTLHQLQPIIDHTFPLADFRAAFEHMQSGSHFGKIVLNLQP
jgi:NADPH:quinone reductase-like Zn-dependent oxidoreductase